MNSEEETVKQTMQHSAAKAGAGGHDLSGFRESRDGEEALAGWRVLCRRCGGVIWITVEGTGYYLLRDPCGDAG